MDTDQSDHCNIMAEELEELRQQLSQLSAVTPPVTVVVQTEHRLRSSNGVDEDAHGWCKDAEAALRTRNGVS